VQPGGELLTAQLKGLTSVRCAWHQVAKYSMLKYASVPVEVIPLKRNELQVIPVVAPQPRSHRWGCGDGETLLTASDD
jgi:hypothetical protein